MIGTAVDRAGPAPALRRRSCCGPIAHLAQELERLAGVLCRQTDCVEHRYRLRRTPDT